MSQQTHYNKPKTGRQTASRYVEVQKRRNRGSNGIVENTSGNNDYPSAHGIPTSKVRYLKHAHKNNTNVDDSKSIDISYNIHPDYKLNTVKTVHFNASVISKPSVQSNSLSIPSFDRYRPSNPSSLRSLDTPRYEIVKYMKYGALSIEDPNTVKRMSTSSPEFKPSSPELKPRVHETQSSKCEPMDMATNIYVSNYINNIFTYFLGTPMKGDLKFVETFDLELAINIMEEVRSCLNLSNTN